MRRGLALAMFAGLALATPAHAGVPSYVPGQVLVRDEGSPNEHAVDLPPGVTVPEGVRELRARPGVATANPNYLFKAAAFDPSDPGTKGTAHGWKQDQWNFLAPPGVPGGVDALGAWQNLIEAGHPGGRPVKVAVLDTGVAYRKLGRRFRRDPDLPRTRRFVKPRDFIDGDRIPLDLNGHGTHVTSTIVQATDNARGLTGLAYGVKVIPVRILNKHERGNAADLARGIRYAIKHGADVINLSIQSGTHVSSCSQVPGVCRALRRAHKHGVSVVAAAGNDSRGQISYPAAGPWVLGVGATTFSSCFARYSNYGPKLDLAAPGGGSELVDGAATTGNLSCDALNNPHPTIRQFSLKPTAAALGNYRRFGFVALHGTSMATAHVSAAAALVRASGVVGTSPMADAVAQRLECTATDLGPTGRDDYYGYGLVDAAAATDPTLLC